MKHFNKIKQVFAAYCKNNYLKYSNVSKMGKTSLRKRAVKHPVFIPDLVS